MKQAMVFDESTTGGHACFVYQDKNERLEVLAEYFKQGIANKELCIFVTPETKQQAIKSFKAAGFDAAQAVRQGSLQIFEMEATYLPHGHFSADYMINNVASFIKEAKAKGFNGLRTAGEMRWITDHPESVADALAYESTVNNLESPQLSFIGLCLYPAQGTLTRVLEGAVQSHPTIVHHNRIFPSPAYQPLAS